MIGLPVHPLIRRTWGAASSVGTGARVLGGAGIIRAYPPSVLAAVGKALRAWGTGPAGGFVAMALRDPDRVGLVDERGSLTGDQLQRRTHALAEGEQFAQRRVQNLATGRDRLGCRPRNRLHPIRR